MQKHGAVLASAKALEKQTRQRFKGCTRIVAVVLNIRPTHRSADNMTQTVGGMQAFLIVQSLLCWLRIAATALFR